MIYWKCCRLSVSASLTQYTIEGQISAGTFLVEIQLFFVAHARAKVLAIIAHFEGAILDQRLDYSSCSNESGHTDIISSLIENQILFQQSQCSLRANFLIQLNLCDGCFSTASLHPFQPRCLSIGFEFLLFSGIHFLQRSHLLLSSLEMGNRMTVSSSNASLTIISSGNGVGS